MARNPLDGLLGDGEDNTLLLVAILLFLGYAWLRSQQKKKALPPAESAPPAPEPFPG